MMIQCIFIMQPEMPPIMMYIKLHSFHFPPQIPPPRLLSQPNDSFMGNFIRRRDLEPINISL